MYRAQKVLCSKTFVIKSEDLNFKNLNEVVLSENCLGFFSLKNQMHRNIMNSAWDRHSASPELPSGLKLCTSSADQAEPLTLVSHDTLWERVTTAKLQALALKCMMEGGVKGFLHREEGKREEINCSPRRTEVFPFSCQILHFLLLLLVEKKYTYIKSWFFSIFINILSR